MDLNNVMLFANNMMTIQVSHHQNMGAGVGLVEE